MTNETKNMTFSQNACENEQQLSMLENFINEHSNLREQNMVVP